MNNPEVTMHTTPNRNKLIALEKAIEATGIAMALAKQIPAPLRSTADQLTRAAVSVSLNLSEGHGRCGRDRFHLWRISYASANEVDTCLRILVNAGVLDTAQASQAISLFDEVRAMTWRLMHPQS